MKLRRPNKEPFDERLTSDNESNVATIRVITDIYWSTAAAAMLLNLVPM